MKNRRDQKGMQTKHHYKKGTQNNCLQVKNNKIINNL